MLFFMNTESVLQLHWGPGQSAHNCTCLLEMCNVIFYEHSIYLAGAPGKVLITVRAY